MENKDGMSGEELFSEDVENAVLGGENTEAEAELADDSQETAEMDAEEYSDESVNEDNEEDGKSEPVESVVTDETDKIDEKSENESVAQKLFNYAELLVFTLAAVILLLSFVFRHAEVIGSSMDTTLANGEHLIISDLFYTPERGDIIVFEDHSTIYKKPLIKRVIAVGGDHIRIKNGVVHINGTLLDESAYVRAAYTMGDIDIVVPDGEVFVMGDNRGASDDSRNSLIGTIDEDAILGKVILRFFPFDSFGTVN